MESCINISAAGYCMAMFMILTKNFSSNHMTHSLTHHMIKLPNHKMRKMTWALWELQGDNSRFNFDFICSKYLFSYLSFKKVIVLVGIQEMVYIDILELIIFGFLTLTLFLYTFTNSTLSWKFDQFSSHAWGPPLMCDAKRLKRYHK